MAVVLSVLTILGVLGLAAVVFRGFNWEQKTIFYNSAKGYGQYRNLMVYGATAACLVFAAVAGLLGFNSLGEKRNNRQGFSWFGVLVGALSIVSAILLCMAWRLLNEPIQ